MANLELPGQRSTGKTARFQYEHIRLWFKILLEQVLFLFFRVKKRRFTNMGEHLLDILPVSVQAWIQLLSTIKVKFSAAAVLEICFSLIFPLVPGMK